MFIYSVLDAVAHKMGKPQNPHPLRNTSYHFNNQKGKKKVMLLPGHFVFLFDFFLYKEYSNN